MEEKEVEGIFKDFKYVDEADNSKEKHEDVKKKAQEAFDKEEKKEKKQAPKTVFDEHEEKGHIKPRNVPSLERIILITIIIILCIFIVFNLTYFCKCERESTSGGTSVVTPSPVDPVASLDENATDNNSSEEEIEEVTKEDEEEEEEEVISGEISIKIKEINYEVTGEDLGKIESITFTIENGKNDVLKPIVNVYAYDAELDPSWETRSRGEYTYDIGISSGGIKTGEIELSPKTFRNLNLEKHVRVVLNSTDGDIVTDKKDITIS